jgi:hypothetical protein
MADVQDPVGETTPAGAPGGADPAISSPSLDPERYQALEAYYSRTNPILEQYKDDFNAIVEDEGYRDFQRKSRESYYDMQKRVAAEREAEIPESEKRIYAHIDKTLEPFKPLVKEYETRAEAETRKAQEASQDFAKKETEYANRLVAEGKLSDTQVNELAELAMIRHKASGPEGQRRFVGIEEMYKSVYGRAEAAATVAKPVAKSLRSTAGATGVPGASRTIEDRSDLAKPGGVTRHILGVLNNQRKTG